MQVVCELVGKTLGEYHVERLLGNGKSSAVYMARQQGQQARTVIITTFIIPETFSAQARERFMARFVQEGAALVRLRHPHMLPIYAVDEQFGYPYLVTSSEQGGSLTQVLKLQSRLTPEQTLKLLKQIAAGLDYAHSNGVIHGMLSPAHILFSSEQGIQVAGFGLMRILELYGIEQNHPHPHLFSIANTFLGTPEYIAPERVQGGLVDARADVYSLGIMLFELLSGTLPFSGTDPLEVAMKRIQQAVPSLHELRPEVPAALDLVVQRALERDPAQRFQSAGEVASAFERVLKVLGAAANASAALDQAATWGPQVTLPPTINWFDEEMVSSEKWPVMPLPNTDKMPAGNASSLQPMSKHTPDGVDAIAMDPFAWWLSSAKAKVPAPGILPASTSARITGPRPITRRQSAPAMKQRRQVVALLATGGVMGLLGLGGIALAHVVQSAPTVPAQPADVQSPPTATPYHAPTPVSTSSSTKHHPHKPKPTATLTTTAPTTTAPTTTTAAPTARPTPKPKPTPTPTTVVIRPTPTAPPSHSGTVIGHTDQPTNSAMNFTNPADGNDSMLIHLPNGNFVACERACTHAGVDVDYDSGGQKLICPAHGAVFDPANSFNAIQGPANSPLQSVSIHVNADGTITVG